MFKSGRWIAAAIGAVVLTVFVLRARPARPELRAEPAPSVAVQPALDAVPRHFIGSIGCASTHCHGDELPKRLPESVWETLAEDRRWAFSATLWRRYDPHRRAFAVLRDSLAEQIERL